MTIRNNVPHNFTSSDRKYFNGHHKQMVTTSSTLLTIAQLSRQNKLQLGYVVDGL